MTELVKDQRQHHLTEQLLKSLLKNHYLEAPVLKSYADHLWANHQYKESYDIYRFLTCLEDKTEHYASSYFKAARFFKETDKAVELLIDRYERYIAQSADPVISLYNALDALERTKEGLDFLDNALLKRPDDGELLLFIAEQYFFMQNIDKTQTLLNRARPLVNQTRYAEMAAKVYEQQQNIQKAIDEWLSILEYEPLNAQANRVIVRLLYESSKQLEADQFINDQLEKYPNNYMLLRIKLDWSAKNNIELSEAVLRTIIEHHSDDNQAHKELSKDYQEQFRYEDALLLAKNAIDIDHNDSDAHCILAQAYVGLGNNEQAICSFRQAIHYSCDCTEAYPLLLSCAKTPEEKKKQLNYIYDELMKQVTFGDGLLEFQCIARNWYSTDELLIFLNFAVNERSDLWQSWLALAMEYRDLRQFERALNTLNDGIKKFPILPRLTYEKADILFLMNDPPKAEQLLKDTLKLSPDWLKVINRLSEILAFQNKTQDAIVLLQNFLKRSPMSVSPYAYLADLLWKNGDRTEAINTLLRVLEISPIYPWVWDRLGEFCHQENKYDIVIDRIKSQQERMPDNQEIAELHAKLLTDVQEKERVYLDFLNRHPQAIDLCISYIQYLVDHQQYEKALELCSEQYWNNSIPISILANKAWIINAEGTVKKAIAIMHEVVELDPNYYDGWRLLVRWYDSIGNTEKILECIEHCERLYPNNAHTLCFVAETLQNHTKTQNDRISDLLKRAFYIDPTNGYNGISYIDILLAENNFDAAREVLNTVKIHNDDVYTSGRELAFYVKQEQLDEALEVFVMLISDHEVNDDLMQYLWNLMDNADYGNHAREIIFKHRQNCLKSPEKTITEHAGKYWALAELKAYGQKRFEKTFKHYKVQDCFDERMLTGYMEYLSANHKKISTHILANNYECLQKDVINWDLVIFTLGMQNDWDELLHFTNTSYQRQGASGRALFFYMFGLREKGDWENAIEVNQYALEQNRDSYYDELLIWNTFDGLINQQAVLSLDDLYHYVDTETLSSSSHYVLTLIDVLFTAQDGSFIDLYQELSPKLRVSQRAFAKNYGHRSLETARKQTRLYLKQTINISSVLKSMFWNWRLSNHF